LPLFSWLAIQEERAARNVSKKLRASAFNLHSKVFLISRMLIIKLQAKWELAKLPGNWVKPRNRRPDKTPKNEEFVLQTGPWKILERQMGEKSYAYL